MSGFLTHYLAGIESCDSLSDNYIRNLIRNNNHAFLIGLQGADLLSFNPHTLSKRGLSYRTASLSLRNQEYAAFFNNMLDHISTVQDQERDSCIAFMCGYLCYYAIDQLTSPYILFRVWQELPAKSQASKMVSHRRHMETILDSQLLRSHCHMEPSQLNFEALTYASRKELDAIGQMMRYTVLTTYKHKIPVSEISAGLRALRRQYVYLRPEARIRKTILRTIERSAPALMALPATRKNFYEDYTPDEADYMNEEHAPWFAYPGCPEASHMSFEEIFSLAIHSSANLLEKLDSCLSWGMDREDLINAIIELVPY